MPTTRPAPAQINQYPVSTPMLPSLSSGQQGVSTVYAPRGGVQFQGRGGVPVGNSPPRYAAQMVPPGWPGLFKTLIGQGNQMNPHVVPGQPGAYKVVEDMARNQAIIGTGGGQRGVDQRIQGTSSGGGGGGGVSSSSRMTGNPIQDVIDSYQKAYEDYLAAVEGRYQDVAQGFSDRYGRGMDIVDQLSAQLGQGYEDRYQRGLANLEGLGTQEKKDLEENYRRLQQQMNQDLVSRGLTGTTIAPTMNMGVQREQQDAMARVNERLQNQRLNLDAALSGDVLQAQERTGGMRLGTDAGLSADLLNFMASRNDIPPDLNQLIQLAQLAGGSGVGGQGFGAGGGGGVPSSYMLPAMMGGPAMQQLFPGQNMSMMGQGMGPMPAQMFNNLPVGARTQMGLQQQQMQGMQGMTPQQQQAMQRNPVLFQLNEMLKSQGATPRQRENALNDAYRMQQSMMPWAGGGGGGQPVSAPNVNMMGIPQGIGQGIAQGAGMISNMGGGIGSLLSGLGGGQPQTVSGGGTAGTFSGMGGGFAPYFPPGSQQTQQSPQMQQQLQNALGFDQQQRLIQQLQAQQLAEQRAAYERQNQQPFQVPQTMNFQGGGVEMGLAGDAMNQLLAFLRDPAGYHQQLGASYSSAVGR